MRVRMRQAQRQMKGTKLQYLDQMPVLFSDAAGVPGAKVCLPAVAKPGLCGQNPCFLPYTHAVWLHFCCTYTDSAMAGKSPCMLPGS